jgi:exonuclease V
MILEFEKSIPAGSIDEVLTAEFRSQNDGALLGRKHFQMDERAMNEYISSGMKWWKGEREARGVEIEDAFKCRICEFADNCTWRKAKAEESMERHRARTRKRSEPTQN